MPDFYARLESFAGTDTPDDRAAIEAELWKNYGIEQAVFVLDLSGFSRTTNRHGIVHCLSMIQRMRTTLEPIVDAHGGAVVKFEADNCFARFPDVTNAVDAAITCNRVLAAVNRSARDDSQIHAAIGIDFGWFLLVRDADFYGAPVNVASKLGEDTATPGQILVTDRVMQRMGEAGGLRSERHVFTISGIDIEAHEIFYDME